jgi:transcriptional regulator with XRE-family HTH domain
MHPILRLLGRNARKQREARGMTRGMTREALCARARVSLYVLTRIEAGESNPGIDLVFRLARALDVQTVDLFKGEGRRRRLH